MKILWAFVPLLAVLGILGTAEKRTDGDRQLQVVGGRTTISFFPSILNANRMRVSTNGTAEGDPNSSEASTGYGIASSDFIFTLVDGHAPRLDSGTLNHSGGFTLALGRNTLSASGFRIARSRNTAQELEVWIGSGRNAFAAFTLVNARMGYDFGTNNLVISSMDLVLTLRGAQALGKPELTNQLVGTATVYAEAEPIDGQGSLKAPDEPQPEDAPIDVALSNMQSLTSVGRVGVFPNGRNGLSMSTTSCNVGTSNIPWFAPMDTRHPVIAMNLYRVSNGRFEQVGWSWLKHGFLSTNSNGCGTCQHPGTGTLLGPNCSDTYGTGNNSDRFYLGGRDEVNPFTGIWTCQGSWFSNFQPDCIRRNNGSGLDAVAHRLEVTDADLNVPGAQWYYEAYYINANDFDKYNNIASRITTPNWNGSTWTMSNSPTPQVQGPAINRWGEMRSTAEPRTEGDVILAVQTTNIGGGMWRYNYALYNHDLDRQIREFSIPMPTGATVQNISFRDIDQDAGNQWNGSYSGTKISWSTGAFGSPGASPLKYSSVFNFNFECNVAPTDGSATLGLFKPGTGTELTAATKAPVSLVAFNSFQLVNGIQSGGNLASLTNSDENRLELGPTAEGYRGGTGIILSGNAPAGTVNSLKLVVEGRNTLQAPGATQTVHMWNWTTSAWELLDTRATTLADSQAIINVPTNASRFVEGTTREVRARIIHSSNLGDFGNRWKMAFDQIGVQYN